MTRFVLAPLAKRDLGEIRDRIAAIAERPGLGHRHESLPSDVRVVVICSYLIIYRREAKALEVVRIVSGYRDIPKLFE